MLLKNLLQQRIVEALDLRLSGSSPTVLNCPSLSVGLHRHSAVCVPSFRSDFWSPLPGPPARMTGIGGGCTHPEITVRFQAWINTELSAAGVECTPSDFPPALVQERLFTYSCGIATVGPHRPENSTTPLQRVLASPQQQKCSSAIGDGRRGSIKLHGRQSGRSRSAENNKLVKASGVMTEYHTSTTGTDD